MFHKLGIISIDLSVMQFCLIATAILSALALLDLPLSHGRSS